MAYIPTYSAIWLERYGNLAILLFGLQSKSGVSGRIAMTIGATLTTRAGELLKLQEQLFLNLAVLFPLRPLQGQTAVTRSTSPS